MLTWSKLLQSVGALVDSPWRVVDPGGLLLPTVGNPHTPAVVLAILQIVVDTVSACINSGAFKARAAAMDATSAIATVQNIKQVMLVSNDAIIGLEEKKGLLEHSTQFEAYIHGLVSLLTQATQQNSEQALLASLQQRSTSLKWATALTPQRQFQIQVQVDDAKPGFAYGVVMPPPAFTPPAYPPTPAAFTPAAYAPTPAFTPAAYAPTPAFTPPAYAPTPAFIPAPYAPNPMQPPPAAYYAPTPMQQPQPVYYAPPPTQQPQPAYYPPSSGEQDGGQLNPGEMLNQFADAAKQALPASAGGLVNMAKGYADSLLKKVAGNNAPNYSNPPPPAAEGQRPQASAPPSRINQALNRINNAADRVLQNTKSASVDPPPPPAPARAARVARSASPPPPAPAPPPAPTKATKVTRSASPPPLAPPKATKVTRSASPPPPAPAPPKATKVTRSASPPPAPPKATTVAASPRKKKK